MGLSFRLRIVIMMAAMTIGACSVLSYLLYNSGAYHLDALLDTVVEYEDTQDQPWEAQVSDSGRARVIDLSPEEFEQRYGGYLDNLSATKGDLARNSWIITSVVVFACSIAIYLLSGIFLKPLKLFSEQAAQIDKKNLTDIRLDEGVVPEFKNLSRSINGMLDRLSAAFEAQKQFSGNAAHELRTPLALMQVKLDECRRKDSSAHPAFRAETLSLLSEQTERLSGIVKTLLSMSELESVSCSERVSLGPLVEEVLFDLDGLAQKNGISLIQEGEALDLLGNDRLLYRAVFNLVENGIKYNRPFGSVTVKVCSEGGMAAIRVMDTGRGVPHQCRKAVFQPFFRAGEIRGCCVGGAGLGLSFVWEVVRMHDGSIEVERSSDEGSSFLVRIPLPDFDFQEYSET